MVLRSAQFVSKYISTIGVDYGVKPVTVNGEPVRINFWDLSGHPDFFEIRNEFYKDSQGVSLQQSFFPESKKLHNLLSPFAKVAYSCS